MEKKIKINEILSLEFPYFIYYSAASSNIIKGFFVTRASPEINNFLYNIQIHLTSITAESPYFTRTRFLYYLLVDRRFTPNIMRCFHFKFTYTTEDAPTILAHVTNIMVKKMF